MSFSKALDFFAAEYPDISFNYFVITDNGVTSFSKISGLTLQSNDLRALTEGGRKSVHILPEQDKQFNTLTLEKGVGRTSILESLGPMRTFIIVSLSKRRLPKRAYLISGALLQKLTISDFNARESSVLINSATVAYRSIRDMSLSTGFEEQALGVSAAAGRALMEGGIGAAATEIAGTSAKAFENGLIESFKSANLEAEKTKEKLKNETDKALDLMAFWE